MQLKDRLTMRRKELKLSREKLAEMANVSPSTITFLENGRNESSKFLVEIANALGVSAEWLKDGLDDSVVSKSSEPIDDTLPNVMGIDPWDDSTPLKEDEIEIPYLKDICVSAGNGCFQLEDYSGRKLRFSKKTLRGRGVIPTNAICVTASGDSMEPVIPDGCVVAVDTGNKEIKDGHIYAINNDGLLQVKILRWVTGSKIVIESYNPNYASVQRNVEDISVIGRVFWYSVLL